MCQPTQHQHTAPGGDWADSNIHSANILQSPVRSDMSRDESIVDDASSVGNKEDDDDDEEDGNDDEKFEGFSGDPERLKAFNVSSADMRS